MKEYLLRIMECLFYIKRIIIIFWFILLFVSICTLFTCIIIGNSPQFHNTINYIAAAGVIGFIISMSMICVCSPVSEQLGYNNRVISRRQEDVYRESSSIIDNLILSKSENDFPAVAVAIYIQDNDKITDPSELPIAQDVSPV